ncbi:MAG TPA: TIM barrel protein, partial [Bryobacteraceae bacterium]|nr:TIM barrel protein [Bryobacteraceae bacterium]
FLAQAGLAQAGAAVVATSLSAIEAFPLALPLGFQSFDLNAAYKEDFNGALRKVAGLGYQWIDYVWMGGSAGASPAVAAMSGKDVRKSFDAAGLACPNCHFSWTSLNDDYDKTIAIAHDLGLKTLVCQSVNAKTKTADGWKWHADGLNELARRTKKDGILTGYHNHPTEFKEVEGKLPFEILASGTDPALVKFQLDLGSVAVAGHDPLATMSKYQGRLFSIHAKDVKDGQIGIAVGEGTLDWKALFTAAKKQGLMNYAVETGARADVVWDKLKRSIDYLHDMKAV